MLQLVNSGYQQRGQESYSCLPTGLNDSAGLKICQEPEEGSYAKEGANLNIVGQQEKNTAFNDLKVCY